MNISNYTIKRKTAICFVILFWVLTILMIIFGSFTDKSGIFAAIFIPISIIVTVISFLYRDNVSKHYKQIVLKDAFSVHDFDYYCDQRGLSKGRIPYNIEEKEFFSLSFVNEEIDYTYTTNDLLVGECENVGFRSVDVNCYYNDDDDKITLFFGRVYAFNLQADKDLKLVIKEKSGFKNQTYNDSLVEIEFESIDANDKFSFYTNDKPLLFKYIKPNIIENLLKIKEYFEGEVFISINNGSLYACKHKHSNSFELTVSATYATISEEINDEISFLKSIINSFDFDKAKPKQNEIKIR